MVRAFLLLLLFPALLSVLADDSEDYDAEDSATSTDEGSSDVPATTYSVPDTKGLNFVETFQTNVFEDASWQKSPASDYAGQSVSIKAPEDPAPAFAADTGLHLDLPATKYGIVSKVSPHVEVTGNDLIVQYELRLQKGLECGGAYLKLLSADADLAAFDNNSPYTIMFGPDKCGGTNKVHFIYKHKNPITGDWEEKHAVSPPSIKADNNLHLYTLIIRKDLSYEIRIDGKSEKHGKLDGPSDFEPPLLPPAEIDDPDDKKPTDWVDEAKIKDPEASKPDDWDEDAPKEIPDMDASKPEGWLDDEPAEVADPDSEMPEDWDEEEDGEWEAPVIANPKCTSGPGCGEWKRPMKTNPDYKGKWTAPLIDNPAYKGVWKPAKIANPGYFEADHASAKAPVAPVAAVAVEIWTMQSGIHFDNIVVSNNIAATETFTSKTYEEKNVLETARASTKAARAAKRKRLDALEKGGFTGYLTYYVGEATDLVMNNMIASVVTLILLLGALIKFCCMGGDGYDEEAMAYDEVKESLDEEDSGESKEPKAEEPKAEEPKAEAPKKRASKNKRSKKAD